MSTLARQVILGAAKNLPHFTPATALYNPVNGLPMRVPRPINAVFSLGATARPRTRNACQILMDKPC